MQVPALSSQLYLPRKISSRTVPSMCQLSGPSSQPFLNPPRQIMPSPCLPPAGNAPLQRKQLQEAAASWPKGQPCWHHKPYLSTVAVGTPVGQSSPMVAQHMAEQLESQVGREMLHPQGLPPGECPTLPVWLRMMQVFCHSRNPGCIQRSDPDELQRQPLTSNPGSHSVVGFFFYHLINRVFISI